MADEVNEGFRAIRTQLLANSTFAALSVPVYGPNQVPQGATGPYCLMDYAAGTDVDGLGTVRLMTEPLFLIRIVNKGPVTGAVRTADKAMDDVIQRTDAIVLGDYEFSARREKPHFHAYKDEANNQFVETGGFYRYYITKL